MPARLVLLSVAIALAASGCAKLGRKSRSIALPAPATSARFAVEIHQPETLGFVEAKLAAGPGPAPVKPPTERVACVTCHSLKEKAPLPESPGALQAFHRGLVLRHGTLACASCHDPEASHRLHRADGVSIEPSRALELCAQCHGPQYRDYQHGAHGGMQGYWDLRRGPRLRNHCVDCHEPHVPAFQPMRPVLPPHDRFLSPSTEGHRG